MKTENDKMNMKKAIVVEEDRRVKVDEDIIGTTRGGEKVAENKSVPNKLLDNDTIQKIIKDSCFVFHIFLLPLSILLHLHPIYLSHSLSPLLFLLHVHLFSLIPPSLFTQSLCSLSMSLPFLFILSLFV